MGVLLWNLFLLLLLALAQQDDFCGYVIIHINICMIHKIYLEMFIILMAISIHILWCEYYWIQSFLILFFMFIFAIIGSTSEGWECVCIYVVIPQVNHSTKWFKTQWNLLTRQCLLFPVFAVSCLRYVFPT